MSPENITVGCHGHKQGYLVPLAFTAYYILERNFDVVKVERARRRSANPKLLLLLCDLDAHVLLYDKARDAFVAL